MIDLTNLLLIDEVLEVNGLRLKGKSVHDICSTLCQVNKEKYCWGAGAIFVFTSGAVAVEPEPTFSLLPEPLLWSRSHLSLYFRSRLNVKCRIRSTSSAVFLLEFKIRSRYF